jgi:hypothetical protein
MALYRAHEFACQIGADTQQDLVIELRHLAERIERGEISAGVMGGSSRGSIYAYRHDPAMTHDEYFRQLDERLKALTPEKKD